jgi:hypothetical protein
MQKFPTSCVHRQWCHDCLQRGFHPRTHPER